MTTCEHCGADAVDAQGTCRACGWHADDKTLNLVADTPSLGETRAADIPVPARSPLLIRREAPQTPQAPLTPPTRTGGPASPTSRATGRVPSVSTRYCGTCGARIETGEQYCGQCGTPIAANAGTELRTAMRPTPDAPGRYPGEANRGEEAWNPYDNDAPTEGYAPSLHGGLGQSYPGYVRGVPGAYPGEYGGQVRRGPNRELRIVLGILCILGGLVSGAGAIILAFVGR